MTLRRGWGGWSSGVEWGPQYLREKRVWGSSWSARVAEFVFLNDALKCGGGGGIRGGLGSTVHETKRV